MPRHPDVVTLSPASLKETAWKIRDAGTTGPDGTWSPVNQPSASSLGVPDGQTGPLIRHTTNEATAIDLF